jgi:hypothetical protein
MTRIMPVHCDECQREVALGSGGRCSRCQRWLCAWSCVAGLAPVLYAAGPVIGVRAVHSGVNLVSINFGLRANLN